MKRKKKKRKKKKARLIKQTNPVAKFAHKFNRAETFKDKTKYNRKDKHNNGIF